jgi:ribosome-binding ATPase
MGRDASDGATDPPRPTDSRGLHQGRSHLFDDLVATGSIAEARAKGKARIEGKDYVMQDGDVVEFRFNV